MTVTDGVLRAGSEWKPRIVDFHRYRTPQQRDPPAGFGVGRQFDAEIAAQLGLIADRLLSNRTCSP